MGRQWYENGKFLKKKNTFTDFITCAEYLLEQKYSSKEKLCIEGRSAGGLLIGAVLNMRPDLFKAAVAGVPFVDVLTTMLDPSIPLTTEEWEVMCFLFCDEMFRFLVILRKANSQFRGLMKKGLEGFSTHELSFLLSNDLHTCYGFLK